jgi:hypothetical protein
MTGVLRLYEAPRLLVSHIVRGWCSYFAVP